jgi:hypothetical protein
MLPASVEDWVLARHATQRVSDMVEAGDPEAPCTQQQSLGKARGLPW